MQALLFVSVFSAVLGITGCVSGGTLVSSGYSGHSYGAAAVTSQTYVTSAGHFGVRSHPRWHRQHWRQSHHLKRHHHLIRPRHPHAHRQHHFHSRRHHSFRRHDFQRHRWGYQRGHAPRHHRPHYRGGRSGITFRFRF